MNLYLTSAVILLLTVSVRLSAQPGCERVDPYIRELKTALRKFIPDPGSDKARDKYLAKIKDEDRALFREATRLGIDAGRKDSAWISCFQRRFIEVEGGDDDAGLALWAAYLFKRFSYSQFVSPEFRQGFGIHLDVNQGVADLGKDSEAYSFTGRVLLAYTFKGKSTDNIHSGGRVRLLGGVSTFYAESRFDWYANPRLEFRLLDIGGLTSFGNVKAIVDANIGDTWIIGGGLGLELAQCAGLQVMYARQGAGRSSHLQIGVFYRFLK